VTLAHKLMDFGLWCLAALWLCQFLAEHLRTKPPKHRRMPPPSSLCERTPDWSTVTNSLTRRQAE